jgi:alpha/beta superfamily hydrolase
LKCSFFEVNNEKDNYLTQHPVIIYLHCFNGSRIESIKYAEKILEKGVNFFCFDFSGSGLSDGEYVSLGFYEMDDVEVVVNYLKREK